MEVEGGPHPNSGGSLGTAVLLSGDHTGISPEWVLAEPTPSGCGWCWGTFPGPIMKQGFYQHLDGGSCLSSGTDWPSGCV